MNAELAQELVQIVGAFILLAVTLQVLFMLVSSLRRREIENKQQNLSLEALRLNVNTALVAYNFEKAHVEQGWNGNRKFEIMRKDLEVEGIHSFYLAPHDGKALPPFLPGQYLTFELKIPGESKPVIRCYSLSDSPNYPDYYRVSIKKIPPPRDDPDGQPGRSSSFFNDVLVEGDIVDAKAPSGHFYLKQRELPTVLIGGGIGITPVLSMLNTLCEQEHKGEVWFFLGVRNSAEHFFKDHLETLDRAHQNLHLRICYSNPLEEDQEGGDYHHKGYVSVDLFKDLLPSNNYEFYICAGPPMMESIVSGLYDWGVPEDRVHFEAFGKATVKKAAIKKPAEDEQASAAEISVTFERSDKTLKWDSNAESLLDFAEDNDITLDCACRSGNCGTCLTAIKSGKTDYVVEPGFAAEDGTCLTCISVPKEDLTLDA